MTVATAGSPGRVELVAGVQLVGDITLERGFHLAADAEILHVFDQRIDFVIAATARTTASRCRDRRRAGCWQVFVRRLGGRVCALKLEDAGPIVAGIGVEDRRGRAHGHRQRCRGNARNGGDTGRASARLCHSTRARPPYRAIFALSPVSAARPAYRACRTSRRGCRRSLAGARAQSAWRRHSSYSDETAAASSRCSPRARRGDDGRHPSTN